MLSRTAEYALRAVLLIAGRENDGPLPAVAIAEALDLPANYLAKTLHRLTKAGVLVGSRGAAGGYALAVPAAELSLARVVETFDLPGTRSNACLLGDRACDPRDPCTAHEGWIRLTGGIEKQFHSITVARLRDGEAGARRSELQASTARTRDVAPDQFTTRR